MERKAISLNALNEASRSGDSPESEPCSLPANPFVGLRSYQSTEGLLFFGRREETVDLLQQLHRTRFLAVVGSSGCGKSSLIRAGLIPKLKAGFLVERRDQWHIAAMKPGDSPLENLALVFLESLAEQPTDGSVTALVQETRLGGSKTVLDWLGPRIGSDANLLLLVDQFEEIFRFGLYTDEIDVRDEAGDREERRDEAAEFVSIMLSLTQQQDLPIYVVMTMRSDFLGECDAFYGLPEAMNRSQYLVPRLTRQQRQEAIEGPIHLFGEEITARLLDRVVNDIGEESDQLPIMQHAMMRTWEEWRENRTGSLDISAYEAIGTIKDALSLDAERALEGMNPIERRITERIFQALTERDTHGRRLRTPAHLNDLVAISGGTCDEVISIIERFRSNNRSFLTLSEDRPDGNPLVDISHESLIRQWGTLREWVDTEAESKEQYLRLAGDAVRYEKGYSSLWSDPGLQLALEWWHKRQPNEAWARRYHPEFALTKAFLDKGRAKRESDAARERRKTDRIKKLSIVFAILLVVLVPLLIYAIAASKAAKRSQEEADDQRKKAEGALQQVEQALQKLTLAKLGIPSLQAILVGHRGAVNTAAFSPDGKLVVNGERRRQRARVDCKHRGKHRIARARRRSQYRHIQSKLEVRGHRER